MERTREAENPFFGVRSTVPTAIFQTAIIIMKKITLSEWIIKKSKKTNVFTLFILKNLRYNTNKQTRTAPDYFYHSRILLKDRRPQNEKKDLP